MNAKLWAALTELENALPLSQVTGHHKPPLSFHTVFRPDEPLIGLRLECDAPSLGQILDNTMEQEILGALELAPIAVEKTVQQGDIHVTSIRRKAT